MTSPLDGLNVSTDEVCDELLRTAPDALALAVHRVSSRKLAARVVELEAQLAEGNPSCG